MPTRPFVRFANAAVLAALAGVAAIPAQSARAVDKWWNTTNGNWGTGGNWLLPGAPGIADNVLIGNTAAAQNAIVELNVNATVANLTMTDGMRVQTNASKLTVTGSTLISGSNLEPNNLLHPSMVQVFQGAAPVDFQTGALTITDGGSLWIEDGATVQAGGFFHLQDNSSVYAEGVINLTSNASPAMRIDGILQAAPSVAGLTINQLGSGTIDLDGSTADGANGGINLTGSANNYSTFAHLTINGTSLSDTFGDTLWIGPGNTANMNLSNGWTVDPNGIIRFSSVPGHIPTLNGGYVTLQGQINLATPNGNAIVNAPMTLASASDVTIASGARLTVYSPVAIRSATFSLASDESEIIFNGVTDWNGAITAVGPGVITPHNTANVTGPTSISANVFDIDGSGNNVWNIQHPLTVVAAHVDGFTDNFVSGVLNVSGGASSRLSVSLTVPGAIWTMDGIMNLTAPLAGSTTRLDGTTCAIAGALNINGSVRSEAGYGLYPASVTTFASAASRLENTDAAMVFSGASFAGGGSLVCAASGSIHLGEGADLGTSSLINHGNLDIDFGVGQARVGGFTQSATGTYNADIGGYTPGTRHDHLVVTLQPAQLGGMIDVSLVDAGDGPFTPQIGDTFTILTSRNGLIGSFAGVAPTLRNGVLYSWTILQDSSTVSVQLVSIESRCDADWNCDGFLDGFDYDDFVNTFEGGTPPNCQQDADFNGDGFVDGFDYDDFVAFFESGC